MIVCAGNIAMLTEPVRAEGQSGSARQFGVRAAIVSVALAGAYPAFARTV